MGLFDGVRQRKQARKQRAHELNMQQIDHDFEERMFQEEKAWEREQYDYEFAKEAEYNSPQEQRKRLEEAGLNPYLMLDGGDAGSVDTSASANADASSGTHTPTDQNKHVDLFGGLFNFAKNVGSFVLDAKTFGLKKAVSQAEARLIGSQADRQDIANGFAALREQAEYNKIIQDGDFTKAQKDESARRLKEAEDSWNVRLQNMQKQGSLADAQINSYDKQADSYEAQARYSNALAKSQELGLPYVTKEISSRISKNYADAQNARAQSWLSEALYKTEEKSRKSKVSKLFYEDIISKAEATIKAVQSGIDKELTPQEKAFIRQLHIDEYNARVQHLEALAEKADKEAAMVYYREAMNGLQTLINGIFAIGTVRNGARKGRASGDTLILPSNEWSQPPEPYN